MLALNPAPWTLASSSAWPHRTAESSALCASDTPYTLREGQILAPMLLYHFVGRETLQREGHSTSRYNVTAADFEKQLRLLDLLGYHTVTVSEVVHALKGEGRLPPRPIAITFDDGWAEQYTIVFPLLQKYNMRATFYIPSTYPRGGRTVSWEQIQEMMAAGMEIGSHTRRHIKLTELESAVAWTEIAQSRRDLAGKLGVTPATFAYPFGEYDAALVRQVMAAGYSGGVSLGASPVQSPQRLFTLTRLEVHGTDSPDVFLDALPWRGEHLPQCHPFLPWSNRLLAFNIAF